MKPFGDRDDSPRFAELDAEYEILHELGRGGTAVVYLARERELGRKVAIKVIRATYVEDEEAAARLVREARTVGGLQHPNIVMLYGTRRLGDRSLALIMQYVHGRTLKSEVQERGPLPFARVEQVLRDVASALAYAHRHRIVHRDLKPENIYVDDETGIARLSDFGIARPWDADSSLTLPGTAIGTPAYMSPEQIDGGALDGRSDLYSLGMVGYEMLTGSRPWAGESLFGIVFKQKHEDLPPLTTLRPGIPSSLVCAIDGALRKNPTERWPDASAFLDALNGGAVEAPVRAVREAPPVPAGETGPAESARTTDADSVTIIYRRPEGTVAPAQPRTPSATAVQESAPQSPPVPVRRGRRAVLSAALLITLLAGIAATLAIGQSTEPEPPAEVPEDVVDPVAAVSAEAAPPVIAYPLFGDEQTGRAGDTLSQPLVLVVENGAGRPAPGVTVRFRVASGAGTAIPAAGVTDSAGAATTRWVLGKAGQQALVASIEGLADRVVTFRAIATPRAPARLTAASPTNLRGSTTTAVVAPVVVRVEDDRGDPVAGVEVRFAVGSGGGRVTPAATLTGSDGTARTQWSLGLATPQDVVASVVGLPATVAFRAVSSAPVAAVRRGIAAGGTHTCSLGVDGAAWCWGGNDSGQLGDGSGNRSADPVRVAAAEPLTALSAGVGHTCAVAASASILCWGSNTVGQLGDGTRANRAQPVKVAGDAAWASVAAGMSHSCALDRSGRLFCWGQNTHGQLGDGSRTDRSTPVRARGGRTFRSFALGWAHTCALTADGTAFCWGRNGSGELGIGVTVDRGEPAQIVGEHRFTTIAAGSAHTCGVRTDGTVLCWGQNRNGQLGNGTAENSAVPVPVQFDEPFSSLTVGGVHTCAITRSGAAHCWGRNTYGQLGDGTIEDRLRPTAVAGGIQFSAVHASGAHTCGSTSAGRAYCWGYNLEGQLGDGTRTNQPRPVAVAAPR